MTGCRDGICILFRFVLSKTGRLDLLARIKTGGDVSRCTY